MTSRLTAVLCVVLVSGCDEPVLIGSPDFDGGTAGGTTAGGSTAGGSTAGGSAGGAAGGVAGGAAGGAAGGFTCSNVAFAAPLVMPAGNLPADVVAADVDLDGWDDIVVPEFYTDRVAVYVNERDGGFNKQTIVYPNPQSVAVGDFDHDGQIELATANWIDSDLTVMPLRFDGGTRWTIAQSGNNAADIQVLDFNRDGLDDLVVAQAGNPSVGLYLRKADGGYTNAGRTNLDPGVRPEAIAVGDWDLDGRADVVVANMNGNVSHVLLANDAGFDLLPSATPQGFNSRAVALGDLDGDGRLEAVMGTMGPTFAVYANAGDAGLGAATRWDGGVYSQAIAVSDMNGDRKLDVVVGDYLGSSANIALGNGDGTFQQPRLIPNGEAVYRLATGDFNHDGKPDIVTTTANLSPTVNLVTVLINTCTP